MTPMNFRWAGAWGSNATLSGSLRFERRVRVKLNWWNGSPIRAQYAALVDVGPLFLRTRAFLHVGGFNEGFSAPGSNGYYHDWEFSTRLWLSGWRAAFQETRMTGLTCVCFHCLASHASREKRCEKEVAKGTVRMGANYNDVSTSMSKRREASMHTLRRYYVNISRAVGRLNTRMAGTNGFLPFQGIALVKWVAGPAANECTSRWSSCREATRTAWAPTRGAATRGATSSLDDTFKCT